MNILKNFIEYLKDKWAKLADLIKEYLEKMFQIKYGKVVFGVLIAICLLIVFAIINPSKLDNPDNENSKVYNKYLTTNRFGDVMYTGIVLNEMPNGQGKIVINNEEDNIEIIIEGIFENGKFITGTVSYNDDYKNILNTGVFNENKLLSGESVIKSDNIEIIRTGTFKDFLLDGDCRKSLLEDGSVLFNIGGYFEKDNLRIN